MESSFVSILNIFSHCHNFNIFARLQDSGIWHQMMVRCKLKHFLSWSSPVTSWKLYIEDQGHFQHIIELCEDTMSNITPYIVAKHSFFKTLTRFKFWKHCIRSKSSDTVMLWTAVAGRWHVVVPAECDWAPLGPHVWAQETRNPAGGTEQPRTAANCSSDVKGSSQCLLCVSGWKWVKSTRVINTAATIHHWEHISCSRDTRNYDGSSPAHVWCSAMIQTLFSVLCRRIIFH